jgi:hypothetical protein
MPPTELADLFRASRIGWSPDGKWLAFPDREGPGEPPGIFLVSIETGKNGG